MINPILPRITVAPKSSFFLFGARGVGKSTWARETLAGAHRFDLLDEGLFQSFLADPALFGAELRTLEPGSWVVVDEVQRIPGLLNEVHRAIEELRLHFALLGSSARKLKTAGTNLLAGRALWRTMYPFVPQELGGRGEDCGYGRERRPDGGGPGKVRGYGLGRLYPSGGRQRPGFSRM